MARCDSARFGTIDYEEAAVVHFPDGLPAFEKEKRFLLIEQAETSPIVFLQSLATPGLAFIALPARLVDPGYRLELTREERETLEIGNSQELVEGEDHMSLAILTVREGQAITANLLAPVVIGARSRRALQAIQADLGYRVDHPLGADAAAGGGRTCL